jgi:predicted phosphodiesterase
MQFKTGLVFGDIHFKAKEYGERGGHDERSWEAFLKYVSTRKWDYVINLGDTMDFPYLHRKAKMIETEKRRIQKDYAFANEQVTRLTDRIYRHNPRAEIIFIEGNHDEFVYKNLIANFPVLEDAVLTVDKGLMLKERGIKWIPYWTDHSKYLQIGKAIFLHGLYTNQSHFKKMYGPYGTNSVFYGHVHDMQCYTPIIAQENKLVIQSLGCLCSYDQPYLNGSPTNWQQGFAEFKFYPDGRFDYVCRRIFDHEIRIEDKIYKH